ncbi:MAG: putative Ig domain-containing protein [Proteobacteria bacterium]|nr:putative Ig domain-containing protein [Pseudomonadota bacterium]
MALALNTSDPLYPALTLLFCVDDDNTVKELRANVPCTVKPGVLLPNSVGAQSTTTPYGRSFRTMPGTSPYDFSKGVTFPEQLTNTNQPISVFIAFNRYNSDSSAQYFSCDMVGGSGPLVRMRPGGKLTSAVYPGVPTTGASTSGAITTAQNTVCLTRNAKGANSVFMYINGVIDPAFAGGLSNANNEFGVTDPPQKLSWIGGFPGYGWVSCDWVYVAIFVGTQLGAADVLRLHNSLTGNNNFALIAGGASQPLAFSGTVPAQSGTQGSAFAFSGPALSSYFSGGTPPYGYAVSSGTLPVGLSLSASTGVISGTPSAAGSATIVVRATDAAASPATADTNAFTITISAPTAPQIVTQPSNQTVTAPTTATFSVVATGGGLSYQWQRNTVAVPGATSASYTTPATSVSGGQANNGDSYRVVVSNAGGSVTSNAATLTVNAGVGGQVVSDVISNGSGTVLSNTPFSYSYFPGGRFGSLTGIAPREGTVTSDAGGRCTIGGLPSGSGILLLANRSTSASTDGVYYQAVMVA